MSIRLRFTLIYSIILGLTLAVFGAALYTIQANTTLDALKAELVRSSEVVGGSLARLDKKPPQDSNQPPPDQPPPVSFEAFSGDSELQKIPEREIVRVLDPDGNLVASPFGRNDEALPLSDAGLSALQDQQNWWETSIVDEREMLIFSRPLIQNSDISYILQIARPLTERNQSLQALATTLVIASLVTLFVALVIGWMLSGITLHPIQRITQTAGQIGKERDFTRRVDYSGPPDEVGQLATTFNAMLSSLEAAYQRTAHALEMQRNFVADVSHELRTPLTTLRGNLSLLRHTPPVPAEDQADILNDLVDESDRLIRLVNELLVLARADAKRNLAHEAVELLPVIDEAVRQAKLLAPEREILTVSKVSCIIQGDRDALKQVLLILLDNALKHSSGKVEVHVQQKTDNILVVIKDHGQGIPADQLAHVFERFYRAEDTASPGFGLGLSIAKSLVEGQGGSLSIQSVEGTGSTVTVSFQMGETSGDSAKM